MNQPLRNKTRPWNRLTSLSNNSMFFSILSSAWLKTWLMFYALKKLNLIISSIAIWSTAILVKNILAHVNTQCDLPWQTGEPEFNSKNDLISICYKNLETSEDGLLIRTRIQNDVIGYVTNDVIDFQKCHNLIL